MQWRMNTSVVRDNQSCRPVDDCVPRSVGVPAGRRPASGGCLCYSLAFRQNHLISISNVRCTAHP